MRTQPGSARRHEPLPTRTLARPQKPARGRQSDRDEVVGALYPRALVERLTGLYGPLLGWQIAAGNFPSAVQIGSKRGWLSVEVDAVIAARAGDISEQDLIGLVRGLIAERAGQG